MKSNIMFVDDSISVLESLRLIFMDEPYHVFAFNSPHEALCAIEGKEFAVVVAEQSMTEMDGIEFLNKVKQRSPDTEGIIMYGFVKSRTASSVITDRNIYRFIKKPLDINEIKQAVAVVLVGYESNIENRKARMSIYQLGAEILLQQ
ncbi:MAG: response regulator [Desulfobacterales bacterium]